MDSLGELIENIILTKQQKNLTCCPLIHGVCSSIAVEIQHRGDMFSGTIATQARLDRYPGIDMMHYTDDGTGKEHYHWQKLYPDTSALLLENAYNRVIGSNRLGLLFSTQKYCVSSP